MNKLLPWALGPFELILHAESHLRNGDDFDRRIALISFDNSIEVSITTYLSLHPLQRGNRTYRNEDILRWLNSYYTKLEFLETELIDRGLLWVIEKSYIIWAHSHRNEQYHGGNKGVPEKQVLSIIRGAALWIFSILYEVHNIEEILNNSISTSQPPSPPQSDKQIDRIIDNFFEMVRIGGYIYHPSEVLFAVDIVAYHSLGELLLRELIQPENKPDSEVTE